MCVNGSSSGNREGEARRRPNSVIVPLNPEQTAGSSSEPVYVNVPGYGATNEGISMTALNLASSEEGKDTEQENEVPDTQIMSQSYL